MGDLLDKLVLQAGLGYLSDLSSPTGRQAVAQVVDAVPHGLYTLEQWTVAVRYILLDETLAPKSEAEARALLRV